MKTVSSVVPACFISLFSPLSHSLHISVLSQPYHCSFPLTHVLILSLSLFLSFSVLSQPSHHSFPLTLKHSHSLTLHSPIPKFSLPLKPSFLFSPLSRLSFASLTTSQRYARHTKGASSQRKWDPSKHLPASKVLLKDSFIYSDTIARAIVLQMWGYGGWSQCVLFF